ncbi:MAG: QueT transporter family protein [Clostridiales bacterium]|nr:QueT transporter family protein [Clostridiales bacterium]
MDKTKFITQAAIIGAIYAALTILAAPFSYGLMQVRISEALTILPFFTPAAIPGLFVGCIVANYVGGYGLLDIVLGSLATITAAFITYKMKNKILAPLPPVIMNALIIGIMLSYLLDVPVWASIAWVGIGELIACYGLGYPLLRYLEKYKDRIFNR